MNKNSNLNKYKKKKPIASNSANNETVNIESKEKNSGIKKSNFKTLSIDDSGFTFWTKYAKFLPWIVIIVTFLLFINSINNDFVNWDDDRYVTKNPFLDFNFENIKYFFSNFYFVMYIPLSMISYMIDYTIAGVEKAWVYHLHNLIIHLITTILVFYFSLKLFQYKKNQKYIYAYVIALLFGIHPIHVESVSWIAERKDVLFSMFFVASLLVYIFYVEKKKYKYLILSFVFYTLSLFSKTQAVVLPLVLLSVDYYLREFLTDKEKLSSFIKFKDKMQWRMIAEKIPFFVLSLIFGIIAIKASGTNEPLAESFDTNTKIAVDTGYSLLEKGILMSYSLFLYVIKIIFPFKQSAIHPYPFDAGSIPRLYFIYPAFSLLFFSAIIWSWIKQKKEILFGLLFFIINLILVLHIKNFIISEHYAYIPAIGISIILVYFVIALFKKNNKLKPIILTITLIYICLFSYKTFDQNQVFKNSYTFWNDVTSKYPQVIVAYYNRGNYLQELGDNNLSTDLEKANNFYNEAIVDYTKTIELQKTNIGAFSNRGITYAKIGKYDDAIKDFNEVVKLDSTYGNVYSNRGNAYGLLGKWDKAIADYNKAVSLNPDFADAIYNRGIAYTNINKNTEAIKDFNKVLKLQPNKTEIYYYRGISYFYSGNIDSAISDFNTYLKIDPSKYILIYYRALSYEMKGENNLAKADFDILKNKYPQIITDIIRTAESVETQADYSGNIQVYRQALDLFMNILKINPQHSVAHSRIGVIFGKMGDLTKAFEYLNKAVELDNNNYQAYADRGYAYSLTGNTEKSIKDYEKALEINPNDFNTLYNMAYAYELQKNYIKSLELLNKAIDLNNNNSLFYFKRGQIHFTLNQKQEACNDWKKSAELQNKQAADLLSRYCN